MVNGKPLAGDMAVQKVLDKFLQYWEHPEERLAASDWPAAEPLPRPSLSKFKEICKSRGYQVGLDLDAQLDLLASHPADWRHRDAVLLPSPRQFWRPCTAPSVN